MPIYEVIHSSRPLNAKPLGRNHQGSGTEGDCSGIRFRHDLITFTYWIFVRVIAHLG